MLTRICAAALLFWTTSAASSQISGTVLDMRGRAFAAAEVTLSCGAESRHAVADELGRYAFVASGPASCTVTIHTKGFADALETAVLPEDAGLRLDSRFRQLVAANAAIEVADRALEPSIDLRNSETFNRTLFSVTTRRSNNRMPAWALARR